MKMTECGFCDENGINCNGNVCILCGGTHELIQMEVKRRAVRAYELIPGDSTKHGDVLTVVADRRNTRFTVRFAQDGEEVKKTFKRSETIETFIIE